MTPEEIDALLEELNPLIAKVRSNPGDQASKDRIAEIVANLDAEGEMVPQTARDIVSQGNEEEQRLGDGGLQTTAPVLNETGPAGPDGSPLLQELKDEARGLLSAGLDPDIATAISEALIDPLVTEDQLRAIILEARPQGEQIDYRTVWTQNALTELSSYLGDPELPGDLRRRMQAAMTGDPLAGVAADGFDLGPQTSAQYVRSLIREAEAFYDAQVPEEIEFFSDAYYPEYKVARDQLAAMTRADQSVVDYWIDKVATRKGYTSYTEVVQDPVIIGKIQQAQIGNTLPGAFYDENGNFYVNALLTGPAPVASTIGPESRPDLDPNDPDDARLLAELEFEKRAFRDLALSGRPIPTVHSSDIQLVLANDALRRQLLAGRGSGSGRAEMKFDRRAIREGQQRIWGDLMLEDADDALVDQYIRDVKAHGASLSLEAWTKDKMRQTQRYAVLYGRKPTEISEEEFVGRYRGIANQTGMNDRFTKNAITSGLQSGVGQRAFATRLTESRDYQVANLGDLSQRFAQTVNSLGSLTRS